MADDTPTPTPTPGGNYVEKGGKECKDESYFISVCETGFVDPTLRRTIVEASATLNDCEVCVTAAEVRDAVDKINEIYAKFSELPTQTEITNIEETEIVASEYGVMVPEGFGEYSIERQRDIIDYQKNGITQRYVGTPVNSNEYTYDSTTDKFIFGESTSTSQWHLFKIFPGNA
jgi:hypothetical protein